MTSKNLLKRLASPFQPAVTMYVLIRAQIKDQLIIEAKTKLEQEKQGKSHEQILELESKYTARITALEVEKKALKDKLQFFNKQT